MTTEKRSWRPAWFPASLQGVLKGKKWKSTSVTSNGDCGLETLAVAFRLPAIQVTYNEMREFIAWENPDIGSSVESTEAEREKRAKPGVWISIDDINFICMKQFNSIPIIINTSNKKNGMSFVFDATTNATFTKLLARLKRNNENIGRELQYIIISYSGDHFELYGAECKQVPGHSKLHEEAYRTVFPASRLPQGLLADWQEQRQKYLALFLNPKSKPRRPKSSTVVVQEISD